MNSWFAVYSLGATTPVALFPSHDTATTFAADLGNATVRPVNLSPSGRFPLFSSFLWTSGEHGKLQVTVVSFVPLQPYARYVLDNKGRLFIALEQELS
jgi:hypothetical protein